MGKKSSFAGFLDGYKASNIASIEPIIKVHLDEILLNIDELAKNYSKEGTNEDLIDMLNKGKKILSSSSSNIIEKSVSFTELFKFVVQSYKARGVVNKPEIESKIKKIIFHLLSLAEMSEDDTLLSLAINVGEAF